MYSRSLIIAIALFLVPGALALTCAVYDSDPGDQTLIMSLSNTTDAHAELPSESSYGYGVYCTNESYTIGIDCEQGANLLNLSDVTNAHGTLAYSASYPHEVCVSIEETGISCGYTNETIPEGSTCIVTLSDETNAHFAECETPYGWSVYCGLEDVEFPTWRDNATNETQTTPRIDEYIELNVTLEDDFDLNTYTFSWNDSGSWANESPVSISGTEHLVSLSRQVSQPRGSIIGWRVHFNDTSGKENTTDTFSFTVKNTLPEAPVLDELEDAANTFNRTPMFNWTASDADGDTLTYNLTIECQGGCSSDNREYTGIAQENFTVPDELEFLWDDGYHYTWRVYACDPFGCSDPSEERNFTISGLVSVRFSVNSTDFGSLDIGTSSNTTNDTPNALEVVNEGNVRVNLSVSASTDLFTRSSLPSTSFRIAARDEAENNYLSANTTFFNVPASEEHIVEGLNYQDTNQSVLYDLLVNVPLDEPPGEKQTTITTIATMS